MITGSEEAVPWEQLLADLGRSDELLRQALVQVEVTDRGEKPVAEHLDGLVWHETYHAGQLELLRAVALWRREGN